jgi:hypothetical protein
MKKNTGLYTNEWVNDRNDYYANKEGKRLIFRIRAPEK